MEKIKNIKDEHKKLVLLLLLSSILTIFIITLSVVYCMKKEKYPNLKKKFENYIFNIKKEDLKGNINYIDIINENSDYITELNKQTTVLSNLLEAQKVTDDENKNIKIHIDSNTNLINNISILKTEINQNIQKLRNAAIINNRNILNVITNLNDQNLNLNKKYEKINTQFEELNSKLQEVFLLARSIEDPRTEEIEIKNIDSSIPSIIEYNGKEILNKINIFVLIIFLMI